MVRHLVPPTVGNAGVSLVAAFRTALERFFAGVGTFVKDRRFACLQLPRTVATAHGGLRVAMADVPFEIFTACKLFPTFGALVLFGKVALHVRVQYGPRREALLAQITTKGPFTGMFHLVYRKGRFARFSFSAYRTDKAPRYAMGQLMLLENRHRPKHPTAAIALPLIDGTLSFRHGKVGIPYSSVHLFDMFQQFTDVMEREAAIFKAAISDRSWFLITDFNLLHLNRWK